MTEPSIIRQETLHEIRVTEGSQVAASRSLDPNAPQVRRTLASDSPPEDLEPTWDQEIPPAITAAPADAVVFARHAGGFEPSLDVPDALAQPQADGSIVFERSLQDSEAGDAPVISHALEDRWQTLPPGLVGADGSAGEVIARSSSDHFIEAPPAVPTAPPMSSPAAGQHFQDRFVPVPPREGTTPAPAPLPVGAASRVLPRGRAEPVPPPMPAEQAQAVLLQTAKQAQAKVEETLGAADSSWVEMDFPARVVRLKIENDKVRTKLEQLERMTRQASL